MFVCLIVWLFVCLIVFSVSSLPSSRSSLFSSRSCLFCPLLLFPHPSLFSPLSPLSSFVSHLLSFPSFSFLLCKRIFLSGCSFDIVENRSEQVGPKSPSVLKDVQEGSSHFDPKNRRVLAVCSPAPFGTARRGGHGYP